MMSMLELLNIDKNDDNKMDYAEFQSVTAERIREYFVKLSERFPKLRSRYSEQAWLWHYGAFDQLLEGFHERMSRLTGLPHDLIEVSEPMQVSLLMNSRPSIGPECSLQCIVKPNRINVVSRIHLAV